METPTRPAPAEIARASAPALLLLALAVGGACAARVLGPDLSPAVVFGGASAVAGVALLLPSFRRIAFVERLYENDVFFVAGVVAALVWANVDLDSYRATTEPLHGVVNDVLMAFFFGIAAKEVFEATLPGGPLGSRRSAAMPLVATAGGMLGPALLYLGGCHLLGRADLARGWAIPTATDIAFAALVARLVFGPRHPAIPFLLLLAIADDAGGLAILAVAYPQGELRPGLLLGLVGAGVGAGLLLNKVLRVQSPWPYLVLAGVPAWFGLHEGGVHPALALVPIVPTLPCSPSGKSTLDRFEHGLAAPVALVLALFGLVNAGVPLRGAGAATALVLSGLVLGKPLGIAAAVAAGRRLGLTLPEGLSMRDVVVLGVTAGVGFTVALFVAMVALGAGHAADLDAAKMGALASVGSGAVALALGRALGVERRP